MTTSGATSSPTGRFWRPVCGPSYPPTLSRAPVLLIPHPLYAAAMCRVHYLRVSAPIPSDLAGQVAYYKAHYNTAAGAATVAQYRANWWSAMGTATA